MSTGLAISAVTAVLQYYLQNMYVGAAGITTQPVVTCVAPDLVKIGAAGSNDAENQVNLFLHQVTHNAAWRNVDLAQMSSDGTKRLSNPPLALNLHYLLTTYGSADWQAEALLGYALMMLHEAPTLTREDLTNAMTNIPTMYSTNTLAPFVVAAGLADQIELLKITPETLGREEMAWLWTALKADYRPTFPFQVSVVLLQPQYPSSQPLPVLQRVIAPVPMLNAQIVDLQYVTPQTAALPGDAVKVLGDNLAGATRVSVTNQRYGIQIYAAVTQKPGGAVEFTLPTEAMQVYPAGVYDLAVQFLDSTGTIVQQASNVLPILISPTVPAQAVVPVSVPGPVPGTTLTSVTVTGLTPQVFEGQTVTLSLSTTALPVVSRSATAQPFTGNVTALTFLLDNGLPTATPLLGLLKVDGVNSQVQVTASPPMFAGPWVTL